MREMMGQEKARKLQEIQEACGFVIVGCRLDVEIGHVFDGFDSDPESQFSHVCIGKASLGEARIQSKRFKLGPPRGIFMIKIKAE